MRGDTSVVGWFPLAWNKDFITLLDQTPGGMLRREKHHLRWTDIEKSLGQCYLNLQMENLSERKSYADRNHRKCL
jgi:hypothetical protein